MIISKRMKSPIKATQYMITDLQHSRRKSCNTIMELVAASHWGRKKEKIGKAQKKMREGLL